MTIKHMIELYCENCESYQQATMDDFEKGEVPPPDGWYRGEISCSFCNYVMATMRSEISGHVAMFVIDQDALE